MQIKKLNKLAAAVALTVPAFALPLSSAQAEVSADIGIANMYLWRGLNVSESNAQVSGTLKYGHESGLYAGGWTSSTWAADGLGYELDLFFGYGGSIGDFTFDVSFWEYLYPTAGFVPGDDVGMGDTDASDLVIGLGYNMLSAAAYINTDSDLPDAIYYTLGLTMAQFGATYGIWTGDDDALDYSHLTLSYNPVDSLVFKASMAFSGDTEVEEDPLVQVSYTWAFDI